MDESIQKHLEHLAPAIGDVVRNDAPQKALKLSQAIRIGVKLRPTQCTGDYFQGSKSSCVLGAAWDGYGLEGNPPFRVGDFAETIEKKRGIFVPRPFLIDAYRRNDQGQTREQIADWLEVQGY